MNRTPETLVKETLEIEPTAVDREAVWRTIAERLATADPPSPRPARRLRLSLAGLAALAAVLAAVALLPAGERDRSRTPLLATASAAEVLNATAQRAGSAGPAVGPGEHLVTRIALTIPGEGAAATDTTSRTATDGSARIVTREGSHVTTTTYRAGNNTGVITESGVERPTPPPQLSHNWRYVVAGDEVAGLPAEPEALLAALRARADRAAGLYAQPRPPGYFPRVDRSYELSGTDLLVVETATDLLVEAPLRPAQRAALLSLLADAPGWYRPGSSAEPIRIRNLGPTTDARRRDGIAVRFTIELTGAETRGASEGTFDLVLDPEAGRLLEIRSYEHGADAEPVLRTVVSQRVVT